MKKFLKDFAVYGIASILAKIAGIFLMPIYTSILTKEDYGVMALITTALGIVSILANLEVHSGVARDYYEESVDRKQLVSTGFYSILSLSTSLLFLFLFTRQFWLCDVLRLPISYIAAFTVALFTIPGEAITSYFAILTRYKKKPKLFAVGSIIQLLIQIGCSIYGVVVLRAGIISIFIGTLAAQIFGICFYSYINRSLISLKFNFRILRKILRFGIPTIPGAFAYLIEPFIGQYAINKFVSAAELGVYSIAISLASVFSLLSSAFRNIWGPFIYENYKKPSFGKEVYRLYTLFSITLIMITIPLSLLSREIVLLLSNPSYLGASPLIALLCLPMGLFLLQSIYGSGVQIGRQTQYIGYVYMISAVCNIALVFSLFPIIGVVVVPLSLGVARLITCTGLYVMSNKFIKLPIPIWQLGLYVGVVGACYVITVNDINLITRCIVIVLSEGALLSYVVKSLDLKNMLKKLKREKSPKLAT